MLDCVFRWQTYAFQSYLRVVPIIVTITLKGGQVLLLILHCFFQTSDMLQWTWQVTAAHPTVLLEFCMPSPLTWWTCAELLMVRDDQNWQTPILAIKSNQISLYYLAACISSLPESSDVLLKTRSLRLLLWFKMELMMWKITPTALQWSKFSIIGHSMGEWRYRKELEP